METTEAVLVLVLIFSVAVFSGWFLVRRDERIRRSARARRDGPGSRDTEPRSRPRPVRARPVEGTEQIFDVIEAFGQQWPFTLETVGRITEATLEEADSNEYFATFRAVSYAKSPIHDVEVRLPVSAGCKMDGLIILTIDTGAHITAKMVLERFGVGLELSVPEPAAPSGVTYTYRQHRPWMDLSFEFTRGSEYLAAVIFNAIESPSSAAARARDPAALRDDSAPLDSGAGPSDEGRADSK